MPLKELAERRNLLHRKSDPQTVLKHVLDDLSLGRVAMVSSFGAESVVLLHMVAQINPDTPVLFLDTEMLFDETLAYQREVAAHLGLTDVRIIRPSRATLLERDVDGLMHRNNPDGCCDLRKTQPLQEALAEFDGWVTGRKRIHGGQRAQMEVFEKEGRKIKVNPLAGWGSEQLEAYMTEHKLPRHPLVAKGFKSLGCAPCTTKVAQDEDIRAGRWRGREKSECGIHIVDGRITRKGKAA
jgi:phosphoadenosine phosphosulfate reductase